MYCYYNIGINNCQALLLSCFLMLIMYIRSIRADPVNVNIVVLGYISDTLPSLTYSGPVLDVAVEKMQKDYSGTFNFSITYLFNRNYQECENLTDNTEYMLYNWYYTQRNPKDVWALIAPGCTETGLVARLAASWNTLYISSMGTHSVMRNKTLSPTWIYTGYGSATIFLHLYNNVLRKFNWTTIFLLVDVEANPFHILLASSLAADDPTIRPRRQCNVLYFNSTAGHVDYDKMLTEFHAVSRVLLFFGHHARLRQLLIYASNRNMTDGDHVYIASEPMKSKIYGDLTWRYKDDDDDTARDAFQSLIALQPYNPPGFGTPEQRKLGQAIWLRSKRDYNFTYVLKEQPLRALLASYIAVEMYADVLNSSYVNNRSFGLNDGEALARQFFNRTFTTVTEEQEIRFDAVGERWITLIVTHINSDTGLLEQFLLQPAVLPILLSLKPIDWVTDDWPPVNEPPCGYLGEKLSCLALPEPHLILGASVGVAGFSAIAIAGLALYLYRRYYSSDNRTTWWVVNVDDLRFGPRSAATASTRANSDAKEVTPEFAQQEILENNLRSGPAIYCGQQVYVHNVQTQVDLQHPPTTPTRNHLSNKKLPLILKQLQDIDHVNINKFVGIGRLGSNYNHANLLLDVFCAKGSVFDFYQSAAIPPDWQLAASFISDFVKGLECIHMSTFGFHGGLTSFQCLIDKYFTLKIAKLGYTQLELAIRDSGSAKFDYVKTVVNEWTAPELLDGTSYPGPTSDIYAAGIIMREIIPKPIQNEDQKKDTEQFQNNFGIFDPFQSVTKACCSAVLTQRPTATILKLKVNRLLSNDRDDTKLVDKIMLRLSNYSADLEAEVATRTDELVMERAKCDAMLRQFLPSVVVKQLRIGHEVNPEMFEDVTILFSDICGFNDFLEDNPPLAVTELLRNMERAFDEVLITFDVYKVETIADSYMVASGVPSRNGMEHVKEICSFALQIQSSLSSFMVVKTPTALALRVGVHSGPCAAGVVGFRKPKYCLFGDTVNTASRMCSHGEASCVHLSGRTAEFLRLFPGFSVESRGIIAIKGKEEMETFWLRSIIMFSFVRPAPL